MTNKSLNEVFASYEDILINAARDAVKIKSYSDEEGEMARFVMELMTRLGYDEVFLDSTGNVVGKIGRGGKIVHFDSHLDTVGVNDEGAWKYPPFGGIIAEGSLWGRGSVDMKGALCASVCAAAIAKELGYTEGKTVYVTGTVCEEYCDGESLKLFYEQYDIRPDFCIICEPSDNAITLGHKGKAQVRIKTRGLSAHGSAPEKGINAVYEMAEIISRVERLNQKLTEKDGAHGTVVLSDISCVSASLNAVPSSCCIYLDRRLAVGENLEQVKAEMDELVAGKDAEWEVGTLRHTSWNGTPLVYEPMHNPWEIQKKHPLAQALERACKTVSGNASPRYDFWDFGTNAVTPVAMGFPTIGFGPGEYKLAHMVDERCSVEAIKDACKVYAELINEL